MFGFFVGKFVLLRLRLRFLLLERRFNRGKEVDEFHPWLEMDTQAMLFLAKKGTGRITQYHAHLDRLRERAHRQDMGYDVRNLIRAEPGWLSFQATESK